MNSFSRLFIRSLSSLSAPPKICIVGSGPAGFYAAQHLLKHTPEAKIDVYEKLPVPFGLVRFGVAPDHPEVKNVINTFTKTAQHPNVTFIGNVKLGVDVKLKELQEAYHVVLLAYGADKNRKLNVPGEELSNVIPARRIVGWYNGIPEDKDLKIDLKKSTVVIFGQGNVAIDVARILLTPIDVLKRTDMTQHAIEALSESQINEIYLIGRRGPLQAAFTIKELREILKLPNCKTTWNLDDFVGVKDVICNLARPRRRLTELMLKSLSESDLNQKNKVFKPIFFRSPLKINKNNVVLGVNKLINNRAVLTDTKEIINCDLIITSIGYKSDQVDSDIPFDEENGVAKNIDGKINEGLFTTGWLGTGPSGVILTTMSNSFGVAERISSEINSTRLKNKAGSDYILGLLKMRNVKVIFWEDWVKIDRYEQDEGKKLGKPREKVVDFNKILEII
ncbi:NADPH:adrenodoxin oxidoreductase, mitochondrial [Onthophagus taurus]|uniref:NADPH:adrenodoxin oxidoreductase, mitochondrial n=1 Tax=Onthophagus taurus TaxID=166361 RepID=UPI0039BEC5B5